MPKIGIVAKKKIASFLGVKACYFLLVFVYFAFISVLNPVVKV